MSYSWQWTGTIAMLWMPADGLATMMTRHGIPSAQVRPCHTISFSIDRTGQVEEDLALAPLLLQQA